MATPTRPIAQRDPTVRSPAEIVRRLLFLYTILSAGGGLFLVGAGLTKHRPQWALLGAALVLCAGVLLLFRRRWGAAEIAAEVRANPFKPTRVPKDSAETSAGSHDADSAT